MALIRWIRRNLLLLALMALGGEFVIEGLTKFLTATAEYPCYSCAADRMRHGLPVYLPSGDPRLSTAPFTYPPFFAWAFLPLTVLPWTVQKLLWFTLSLSALLVVVILVARCVAPGLPGSGQGSGVSGQNLPTTDHRPPTTYRHVPVWIFWGLVVVLVGRYVRAGFEMQSHDILVILLVVLSVAAGCRGQEARAGLWAGLAAACKATPLLFAPVFLWQRRFKAAAVLCATVVVATLLPDVLAPSRDGRSWVVSWYDACLRQIRPGDTAQAQGGWPKWNKLNQSLAGTLYRLSELPDPASGDVGMDVRLWAPSPQVRVATIFAAQLGVLVLLAWGTRITRTSTPRAAVPRGVGCPGRLVRPCRPDPETAFLRFGEASAVVCAMLLLSPMSSKAHFAVLLLPVSFTLADFLYRPLSSGRRRDPLVAAAFVVMLLVSSLTVKGLWGPPLGDRILAHGSVCWATVACLLATVRTLVNRRRAGWQARKGRREPPNHALSGPATRPQPQRSAA